MHCPSLRFFHISLLTGYFAVAGSMSQAQNIVVDPGFESAVVGTHSAGQTTGNFLADFGDGAWTATQRNITVVSDALTANTGSQFIWSVDDFPDTFQQTLITTPGQLYELSFFAASNNSVPNTLTVTFDGTTVFDLPNGVPGPPNNPNSGFGSYQQYSVGGLIASSNSAVLSFTILHVLGTTGIDDVSMVAVPEPGNMALFFSLGIAGTGFLACRRKQTRIAVPTLHKNKTT